MSRNEEFAVGSKEHALWYGDAPEQVENDNGYGYKTEYPGVACGNCDAKFFSTSAKAAHIDFRHFESPSRQSQNDEGANDYRGPGER
jgi:hypothetical protein